MEVKAQGSLEGLLALALLLSVIAIFVFSANAGKNISKKGVESLQGKTNAEACALMVDAIYSNSTYAEIEAECFLGEKVVIYGPSGRKGKTFTMGGRLEIFHLEKGVVTGVEPSRHYR